MLMGKKEVVYCLSSLSAAWEYGGCSLVNIVEVFIKREISGPELCH